MNATEGTIQNPRPKTQNPEGPPAARNPDSEAVSREQSAVSRPVRILLLGDICAKPGRDVAIAMVPRLRTELTADFVIVNGENAAAGYGMTKEIVDDVLKCGVDCITSGDHFFDKKEIEPTLESEPRLLRPLNYADGTPGHGSGVYRIGNRERVETPMHASEQGRGQTPPRGLRQGSDPFPPKSKTQNPKCEGPESRIPNPEIVIAVVNLIGRVYLKPTDCPFRRVMPEIQRLRALTNLIVVDFHAEATAEKLSMGWYLDGEVTAVLGTHTHVPTADERILPRGTAYITDVGMCGGLDSVLGMRPDRAIRRMILNIPLRLEPTRENLQVSGVLIEADPASGRALSIERVARRYVPPEPAAQTPAQGIEPNQRLTSQSN